MTIDRVLNHLNSILQHKRIKSISVLCTLTSKNQNNFDYSLLFKILRLCKDHFDCKINIYEKRFKDSSESNLPVDPYDFFKDIGVKHIYIDSQNQEAVDVPKDGANTFEIFYLNKTFFDADCQLILTKAAMHTHHSYLYPFTCIEELVLSISLSSISTSQITRDEYIKIVRDDIIFVYQDLLRTNLNFQLIGILDARNTRITNEHLPFFYRVKNVGLFIDENLRVLRENFIDLLR
jgi:hypothetical protein